nr:N-acetyltransferase [Vitreoscilla sp.]
MPIRQARVADLPAIVAIYNSTVAGRQVTADLHPVSVDERQTWFDAHQKPHRPMMVLCDVADQVLAWATFSDYYARAAYDISAEISIYVDENQRGKRLGQTLLDEM